MIPGGRRSPSEARYVTRYLVLCSRDSMERNCTWLADLRCCRPVTCKKAPDPVVWAVRRLAFRERKRKAPAFGAQGWGLGVRGRLEGGPIVRHQ